MTEEKYQKRIEKANASKQRSFERMKNRLKSKNSWKELIDTSYKLVPYEPKFNIHNSYEHEVMGKAKLCYICKKIGEPCYCEVRLKKRGKYKKQGIIDVMIPNRQLIYEIIQSEKIENIDIKKEYYPVGWTIIPLKPSEIGENFNI